MNRKHAIPILGGIAAAYLFFGLAWISLPGLEADEVLFIAVWYRNTPSNFFADQFHVFGTNFATMMGQYLGTFKGCLWSLFFLLGRSVYTTRIPAVLLGGATLALFYCWVRRWYSRPTALVALLLAATDPGYIATSRLDWGPVVLQRFLMMAGIFAGTSWALDRQRRVRWDYRLAVSGFCFGLALWDKATFAWFLIALTVTLLVLFPRETARRLRPFAVSVFLLMFCLGSLPFLHYNWHERSRGTREAAGWESFDAHTWNCKWTDFRTILDGSYIYGMINGQVNDRGAEARIDDAGQQFLDALSWFAPERATLFPWALAATLLAGAAALWQRRRAVLFPLVLTLAHWTVMALTRSGGGPHHTTLMYPFPHLAIAAAGVWLWEGATRFPVAAALVIRRGLAVALAALALTQTAYDARQLSAYRQLRGTRFWTDANYDIAGYLKANPPDLVVNMDWGFGDVLLLLTDDRVRLKDYYGEIAFGHPDDESAQINKLLPLLFWPNTLFLSHTEPFTAFPSKNVFERAMAKAGKRPCLVRTFYQGTGEAVAQLVRVENSSYPVSPAAWGSCSNGTISITAAGMLSWRTNTDALVFVSADGGPDALMARHPYGQAMPPFLTPDHTFRFTLKARGERGPDRILDSVTYRKDKSGQVLIVNNR